MKSYLNIFTLALSLSPLSFCIDVRIDTNFEMKLLPAVRLQQLFLSPFIDLFATTIHPRMSHRETKIRFFWFSQIYRTIFSFFFLFSSAYVSSESLEILNRAFLSVYVTINCFAVKRLPGANIPFSLREILIHEKNHCFVWTLFILIGLGFRRYFHL